MFGPPLFDDENYLLRTVLPRNQGIFLGDADHPFEGIYVENFVPLQVSIAAAAGGGFTAYNTADQTTNFEKFNADWNTNVYQLVASEGGTGTLRKVEIGVQGTGHKSTLIFDDATAAGPYFTFGDGAATGLASAAASGVTVFGQINPYVNQSGTAGYTALLIKVIENAAGSGLKRLIDLVKGSVSLFSVNSIGQVGIGTNASAPNASALLEMVSTTQGLLLPRMTTAERDAIGTPAAGLVIYNTTTNKLNFRAAAAWEAVTSA